MPIVFVFDHCYASMSISASMRIPSFFFVSLIVLACVCASIVLQTHGPFSCPPRPVSLSKKTLVVVVFLPLWNMHKPTLHESLYVDEHTSNVLVFCLTSRPYFSFGKESFVRK